MKGEFQHNIDAKGRLFIPAKFREELGKMFIITKGLDGCLFVYSASAWEVLEDNINQLPLSKSRNLQRFFFSSAADCVRCPGPCAHSPKPAGIRGAAKRSDDHRRFRPGGDLEHRPLESNQRGIDAREHC